MSHRPLHRRQGGMFWCLVTPSGCGPTWGGACWACLDHAGHQIQRAGIYLLRDGTRGPVACAPRVGARSFRPPPVVPRPFLGARRHAAPPGLTAGRADSRYAQTLLLNAVVVMADQSVQAPGGKPPGPASLTHRKDQVSTGGGTRSCLPRPDTYTTSVCRPSTRCGPRPDDRSRTADPTVPGPSCVYASRPATARASPPSYP